MKTRLVILATALFFSGCSSRNSGASHAGDDGTAVEMAIHIHAEAAITQAMNGPKELVDNVPVIQNRSMKAVKNITGSYARQTLA